MKAPRLSPNRDEICYPYIYETSRLCDYEILTDDLCRQVGGILTLLPKKFLDSLRPELEQLQPMLYHLNGSVRGRCAVSEEDHQWLLGCYRAHKEATADRLNGFVLPRGPVPVPQLNRASSDAKRVLRLLSLAYRWRKASLFPSRSSALVIFSATTSSCSLLLPTRLMV